MNVVSTWVLKNSDKFPIVTIIFHPVGVRSQYLGIHIIPINYKFVTINFHPVYARGQYLGLYIIPIYFQLSPLTFAPSMYVVNTWVLT